MLYSYVYHLFSLETHALMDTSFPFKSLLGTYYPFFIPYNPSISEWPWVSWVWVQIFHTVHHVGLQYSIGINVSHRFYIIISTKTLTSVRHCTYKDVICLDVFSSVDGLCCCMHTFLLHDGVHFTHLLQRQLYDSSWHVWMWHWHFLHPSSARGENLQTQLAF